MQLSISTLAKVFFYFILTFIGLAQQSTHPPSSREQPKWRPPAQHSPSSREQPKWRPPAQHQQNAPSSRERFHAPAPTPQSQWRSCSLLVHI